MCRIGGSATQAGRMCIPIDAISSAPALKITKRDCVDIVRKGESFLYSYSGAYTSRWPEVHQVVAQRRRKGVGIQDTSSCVGPLGVVVARNDSQGGCRLYTRRKEEALCTLFSWVSYVKILAPSIRYCRR